MAEITSFDRNRQIADLQNAYEKKKSETIAKGEADLAEIKDQYKQKADEQRKLGEAAVNHIKKNRELEAQQISQQNRESIDYSRKKLLTNMKELRENEMQQQEKIHAARVLSKEAAEKEAKQIANERTKIQEIHSGIHEKANANLSNLKTKLEKEIQKETKENKELMEKIRADNSRRVENTVAMGKSTQAQVAEQQQKNLLEYKTLAEARLTNMQKEHQNNANAEKASYQHRVETIRNEGRKQAEWLENKQQETLAHRKQRHDIEKSKQEESINQEIEHQKKRHEARMAELKNSLEGDVIRTNKQYEDRLDKLRKDFERVYARTDEINKETFENQREQILRAITNQRSELIKNHKDYGTLKNDPFYQIIDYSSKLEEADNGYIFSTHIPKHEKPNVSVRVHEDKVILSGARDFADKIEKGDRKLATSSYQTFHEEFKLDRPVNTKKVGQFYDDEILTVYIPKK